MSLIRTYSHNNGALGIWRAVILKDCGDGKAYVYIPALHRNNNPFKIVTTEDINEENQSDTKEGSRKTSTTVVYELKEEVAEEIGVTPENETQYESSGTDYSEGTYVNETNSSDNSNLESSSETSDSRCFQYPKANIQSWQVRPPLNIGDAVWLIFENGNIQQPTIVGQLGTVLPLGDLQSGEGNSSPTVLTSEESSTSSTNTEDASGGSEIQKKIANYAQSYKGTGIAAKSGYCEAWNEQVYRNCGINVSYQASGKAAGNSFGKNVDLSKIPLGASVWAIYEPYGHAAIYIGDGKVASNLGGNIPKIETVDNFNKWASKKSGFKGLVWGWPDNKDLST